MFSRIGTMSTIVIVAAFVAGCATQTPHSKEKSVGTASLPKPTVASRPTATPKTTTTRVAKKTTKGSSPKTTNAIQLNPYVLFMTSKSVGWDFLNQYSPTLHGAVWRTEDGGKKWGNRTPHPVSSKDIYAGGLAVNNLAAWLVVATPSRRTILYHTTNGGSSWTSMSLQKTYPIAYLSFVDAQRGWLLASQGPANGQEPIALYRTSDGGMTWSQILSKTVSLKLLGENKTGITFVNRTTGWLTVDFGIQAGVVGVYVTHDGGSHWNLQPIPIPTELRKHYAQPFPPKFSSPHVGLMPVAF